MLVLGRLRVGHLGEEGVEAGRVALGQADRDGYLLPGIDGTGPDRVGDRRHDVTAQGGELLGGGLRGEGRRDGESEDRQRCGKETDDGPDAGLH